MSNTMARLDLNRIIENVSREANQLADIIVENPTPVVLDGDSAGLPEPARTAFKIKRLYHINEFLRFDDSEFVKNAFEGILQRKADDSGYSCYMTALSNGNDRRYLIADLMLSDEGRKCAVEVRGVAAFVWLLKVSNRLGPARRPLRKLIERASAVLGRFSHKRELYQQVNDIEKAVYENQQALVLSVRSQLSQLKRQLSLMESELGVISKDKTAAESDLARLHAELSETRREQALVRRELQDQPSSSQALLTKLDNLNSNQHPTAEKLISDHRLEAYYLAFENACRGSKEEIREGLSVYLPYLGKVEDYDSNQMVDVGCGRGEWLELMRSQGWQATGVDLNEVMVQHCQDNNLSVVQSDAVAYLKSLPDSALSVLSGFHIIEHLPFDVAFNLFAEAYRVLVPGGKLLLETPNPENVLVGSHTFYHDPTHRNPVTPTSIAFLAKYHGFLDIEIIRLHPYPEEAKVVGTDPLTERVNGHLCGPQDYAMLAEKPKDEQ